VLVKINPYAFNPDRIHRLAERNLAKSQRIVNLFLERFNPQAPLQDDEFAARTAALRKEINQEVDLEDARTVLSR
jgi:hypothetical protein